MATKRLTTASNNNSPSVIDNVIDDASVETKQSIRNTGLDKAGVTIDRLNNVLSQGLSATRTVVELINGEQKRSEVIDHAVVRPYLELAYRLRGELVDDKVGVSVNVDARTSEMVLMETRKAIKAEKKFSS